MRKKLAILGSGHLGQQIAHFAISDNHYDEVIFFDDFSTSNQVKDCKILGPASQIEEAFKNKMFDELIIGIGYKHLTARKEFFDKYAHKIPFGRIIHSTSWIDPTAKIEPGVVIFPRCCIDANVSILQNVLLNIDCTISHDSKIGQHSFLSPRVAVAGFVEVGERCLLGINSTVIDNIKIIDETRIGGGAIVIKNIQKKGLFVGNPARFIR